jgi:cell wall-associated NlpC family hydrolase/N-acetylmuramoyl-L-alanine amidase
VALAVEPLDVEGPVPFRPEGRPLEGLVITLDAGHGGSSHQDGYAGSARGAESRVVEGDLNMRVAVMVRHHLMSSGARVHMTRWDDRKVTRGVDGEPTDRAEELGARVQMAEETRSHLFLALHHNSAERTSADGVVVLIWPTDSEGEEQPLEIAFADILREEVEKQVHHAEEFPNYVHEHPLVMVSDIPSAVLEFGFLSNPEFDAWVSQPGSHLAEAVGVHSAVVRMWTENREELEAKREELFAEAGDGPEGDDYRRMARPRMYRVARSLWPLERAPETTAEADHLINLYRQTVLADRTFFYLKASTERDGEQWILSGAANHDLVRGGIAGLLEAAGCTPLVNNIELLPSPNLGEERFGVVQVPMAMTYSEPRIGGLPETQVLLGERVHLLDVSPDGQYLLHQAGEGYTGWVRAEAIRHLNADGFAEWQTGPRATLTRDVMVDDFRLPVGAALPILESGSETARLRLPRGVPATEGAEEVEVALDRLRVSDSAERGREIAETASAYLMTPYVFGGRSGLGFDCSGLSGVAYQAAGVRLPRDARQQILVGELVATPWHLGSMQPGDLIFFCDSTGRVTHEGISLGGLRFIHAARPQVYVSSLDPDDPLYSEDHAERFAFARRPLE